MTAAPSDLLRLALDAFLATNPAPPFVQGIIDYLTTPTPPLHTAQWIPAADEVEIRLELIRQLRKNLCTACVVLPDWDLTAAQLSLLLLMPIQVLREHVDLTSPGQNGLLIAAHHQALMDTRDALRQFLQGAHPQARHRKRKIPGGTGSVPIESGASEPGNASVCRSNDEKQKCQDRDGSTCVFTGAALPDVCHIVPFAINSCDANLGITRLHFCSFIRLFFPNQDAAPLVAAVASSLGCSDKAWNMLCVSTELHRYWARPYWAVRCVGIAPDAAADGPKQRLTMRFYWMRFRADDPDRKVSVDTADDARALLAGLADASADVDGACPGVSGVVAAHHRGSNHPLASGQEFAVVLDTLDEAMQMKRMLDIQWALVTIAAMSGATGPGDDDDEDMSEFDFAREAYDLHVRLYGDEEDETDSS